MAQNVEDARLKAEEEEQLQRSLLSIFLRRRDIWEEVCGDLLFDPLYEWCDYPTAKDQRAVERAIIDVDFGRAVVLLRQKRFTDDDDSILERRLVGLLRCLYLQEPPSSLVQDLEAEFCQEHFTREKHFNFMDGVLDSRRELGEEYLSLEASQTWILYWIAHSLNILGRKLTESEARGITGFCLECRTEQGGFGGGIGHHPHAAATFAATSALFIAGTVLPEAFEVLDRRKFLHWVLRDLKISLPEGAAFRVTRDGESDVRATYCVLATASLLGVLTEELASGVASWISCLRAFDGGFGGEPYNESHGGYTFCALASLRILNDSGFLSEKEFESLVNPCRKWLLLRQRQFEGGFQGRPNKLVDACYAYWIGASCKIVDVEFNASALARYLLRYCQDFETGGFGDKPGSDPDFYHTCYALSGLCLTGWHALGENGTKVELLELDPIYNLTTNALKQAKEFFAD
jgi:protein farnesyltransferase subunit beta